MIPAIDIKRHALDLGFDFVGVAPPSATKDLEFLPSWRKKGFGGEMAYLADPRREDPRRVLPTVKSVVCVGLIYNTSYPYSTEVSQSSDRDRNAGPRAWVSRYAWGRDYHKVMREKLEKLRALLERGSTGVETRVYVDTGPLLERAFARLSGIGWMGKNTCVINEQRGSWFFLGVILTNLQLAFDLPAPDRCGSCTRCLEACPTGALREPYVMDASRCIAYFNIELKGSIPVEFRTAIGGNVFGCDICQDVCPWNNRLFSGASGPLSNDPARDEHASAGRPPGPGATTKLPEFQPLLMESKPSSLRQAATEDHSDAQKSPNVTFSLFNPPLEELASLTEEDFRTLFGKSPLKRVKYRGWLRNLCVAMGNSRDRRFLGWLEEVAQHPDPILREHAGWALTKLRSA
jgi:epoxyqueuosine reductase